MPVTIITRISLLQTTEGINFDLVRMLTICRISWIIFTFDLVLDYTNKLLVSIWVQIVLSLFLFCYERDYMTSLSNDNQADIIVEFSSIFRYLGDLFNIDNPYFEGIVNQLYPPELQLKKLNKYFRYRGPLLDLRSSISYGFVSSKNHDKRDEFDFDILNFPFLDGDVPRISFYGVYISQLIRFAECLDM